MGLGLSGAKRVEGAEGAKMGLPWGWGAKMVLAEGVKRPPIPPLASLRLSREPYATARQFA